MADQSVPAGVHRVPAEARLGQEVGRSSNSHGLVLQNWRSGCRRQAGDLQGLAGLRRPRCARATLQVQAVGLQDLVGHKHLSEVRRALLGKLPALMREVQMAALGMPLALEGWKLEVPMLWEVLRVEMEVRRGVAQLVLEACWALVVALLVLEVVLSVLEVVPLDLVVGQWVLQVWVLLARVVGQWVQLVGLQGLVEVQLGQKVCLDTQPGLLVLVAGLLGQVVVLLGQVADQPGQVADLLVPAVGCLVQAASLPLQVLVSCRLLVLQEAGRLVLAVAHSVLLELVLWEC